MKKIGILVLALVMALGALGVGYAQWTQNLNVTANVNTGNFRVILQDFSPDGDSAGTTATYSIAHTDSSLTINVGNVYPGYDQTFNYKVANWSSIPVSVVPTEDTTGVPVWATVTLVSPTGVFDPLAAGVPTTQDGSVQIQITGDPPTDGDSFSVTIDFVATQAPV